MGVVYVVAGTVGQNGIDEVHLYLWGKDVIWYEASSIVGGLFV